MSARGRAFAEQWISDNINPEAYAPEGDTSLAKQRAEALLAEAKAEGITQNEIEEEVGPVADFVSSAMEESTDDEVARLAGKDD